MNACTVLAPLTLLCMFSLSLLMPSHHTPLTLALSHPPLPLPLHAPFPRPSPSCPSPFPQGVCTFVSALLHYLFLSVFSWMLCEAVVIYNLLVKVFGANKRMWLYIYSALGWGEGWKGGACPGTLDAEGV